MNLMQIVRQIAQKLLTTADPSGTSDQIYARRLGGGDTESELIESISMKVLTKHPGSSLSFIKLITKEVIGEYKKTHHPHHQGTS